MSRFIQVPEPITVVDPVDGSALAEGLKPLWSWERSWCMAVTMASSKGQHDALTLIDLKRKGCGRSAGHYFELTEDEYKIVEPEFRRPSAQAFGLGWAFSAETHIRAVLDAPSKRPAVLAEAAE